MAISRWAGADATLSGNLVENVADFAVGYQYRECAPTATRMIRGTQA